MMAKLVVSFRKLTNTKQISVSVRENNAANEKTRILADKTRKGKTMKLKEKIRKLMAAPKAGFTLIELLVVIAIIGILAR